MGLNLTHCPSKSLFIKGQQVIPGKAYFHVKGWSTVAVCVLMHWQ